MRLALADGRCFGGLNHGCRRHAACSRTGRAPNAPVLELFDDNEIPNPVLDGIYDIGGDVVAFLLRMSPF